MRKLELTVNALLVLPIFIGMGLIFVTVWPANILAILGLYACGLTDLVYAKLPLLRHSVLSSFGPSLIPTHRREAYYRAYRRIALGMALNVHTLVYWSYGS